MATHVHSTFVTATATSSVSVAATLSVTAGNLLVAYFGFTDPGSGTGSITMSSVVDTVNNWHSLTKQHTDATYNNSGQMWYAYATTTGSITVTGNFSATTSYRTMVLAEYSSALGFDPLDLLDTEIFWNGGASSTTLSTSAFTTTNPDDIIVLGVQASYPPFTAGSGFNPVRQTGNYGGLEDKSVSSIQTSAVGTITQTSAARGTLNGAAFKEISPVIPGVITSEPLVNNTGTLWVSQTGIVVNVYNPSTGALVLQKTGQTSNSSGIVVVTDSLITSSSSYAVEYKLSSGERMLPIIIAT